jgi:hypothetical protein
MSATQDSIVFGYDAFYDAYLGVPYNLGLVELSEDQLPDPTAFSAHEPRHVCLAALHGHMINPVDEHSIKARVKDDAPYTKTIAARIEIFKRMVAEFNAEQQRVGRYFGGIVKLVIDDNDPFTEEQFASVGLGGTAIAKAALQYEVDRKYFMLGHAGRLNHFAQHYGFSNLEGLKAFVNRLDVESQAMGYGSYATLCTSTRFMKHLEEKYRENADMKPALDALREKSELLRRESAFTIERFVACRRVGFEEPYFVDVSDDGVFIELREGQFKGAGMVCSQFVSDRNERFHSDWFA